MKTRKQVKRTRNKFPGPTRAQKRKTYNTEKTSNKHANKTRKKNTERIVSANGTGSAFKKFERATKGEEQKRRREEEKNDQNNYGNFLLFYCEIIFK